MYHIDRKNTKPDIGYMEMYVQKLAKRGIRLGDCAALRDRYVELRDTLKLNFKLKYNVDTLSPFVYTSAKLFLILLQGYGAVNSLTHIPVYSLFSNFNILSKPNLSKTLLQLGHHNIEK